jgi:hypothetical protein
MKRPRGLNEWLALCVVTYMKRAKQSEDAIYIEELERIIGDLDSGRIWQCQKGGCGRFCEWDDYHRGESQDDDCHHCGDPCQDRECLCVVCVPDPKPECVECGKPFCDNCTAYGSTTRCVDCEYDEDDLAALRSSYDGE